MGNMPFHNNESIQLFILESLEDIADFHRALNHPTRLEILARLLTQPLEFNELQETMKIAKTSLANHLTSLIEYKLIEKIDRGFYQISIDGEDLLKNSAKTYLEIKIREKERLESLRLRYEALINKYTILGSKYQMPEKSDVKIIKLPRMKVVSFHSMGEFLGDPEDKAWKKVLTWGKPKKIFEGPHKPRVFGFNNPNPEYNAETGEFIVSKEKPYGYEFWITVSDDMDLEKDLKVKTIPGALYAVASCIGVDNLGKKWQELVNWVKESKKYDFGEQQCLEENIDLTIKDPQKFKFEIYVPITE